MDRKVIFWGDVSVDVAVVDLKAPIVIGQKKKYNCSARVAGIFPHIFTVPCITTPRNSPIWGFDDNMTSNRVALIVYCYSETTRTNLF